MPLLEAVDQETKYVDVNLLTKDVSRMQSITTTDSDRLTIFSAADDPFLPNDVEMIRRAVSDAHNLSCNMTTEQIKESTRSFYQKNPEYRHDRRLFDYRNQNLTNQEQLWLNCAQKYTMVIYAIVNFAKMVPGFMKLIQDDQIVLIKDIPFKLAVIRMSKYYNLQTGSVPDEEAILTQDVAETNLLNCILELAKSIAELKLTETELALYSAAVLFNPDLPGMTRRAEVRKLHRDAILPTLRSELSGTREPDVAAAVFDALMVAKIPQLKEATLMFKEALAKLRQSHPRLENNLPELFNEIYYNFYDDMRTRQKRKWHLF